MFLFDEPLSNLDAKLRGQMRAEIKDMHRRLGTTTIYVTHDQTEAMTMADKIVVLRDGRVEQIGAPMDLYNTPDNRFVAGFIGSPAMNFLEGRMTGGEIAFADGTRFPLGRDVALAEGTAVALGVRPRHILPRTDSPGDHALVVEGVEPTGDEMEIRGRLFGQVVTVVLDTMPLRIGDHLPVSILQDRVYLFDTKTGR